MQSTFKFLDLPSEIREQIYQYTAASVFETPAKVAYSHSPYAYAGHKPAAAQLAHHLPRNPPHRNRLAMLYTSRQVYREASQIFYTEMILDLRDLHLDCDQIEVATLIGVFQQKLQFVRHIELDYLLLKSFLKATTTPGSGYTKKTGIKSFESFDWPLCGTTPATIKRFIRLRTYFFSLKSITAYAGPDPDYPQGWAIGVGFMYDIGTADGSGRRAIPRLFPHLNDIRLVSRYGLERFRRTGPEEWELWYSGDKIKKTEYHLVVMGFERDPNLMDPDTGLIVTTEQPWDERFRD